MCVCVCVRPYSHDLIKAFLALQLLFCSRKCIKFTASKDWSISFMWHSSQCCIIVWLLWKHEAIPWCIYLSNLSAMGKRQYKVNIEVAYSWFEFRIFYYLPILGVGEMDSCLFFKGSPLDAKMRGNIMSWNAKSLIYNIWFQFLCYLIFQNNLFCQWTYFYGKYKSYRSDIIQWKLQMKIQPRSIC